ncbi:DUF3224 domain-containing protein [Longivirga aurantiaca]|uniref:DUF3224 domain-containing protein n=1 Tax=Longivirga aurantiaca TaxID=1837743 RepID=A0ABW1T0G6_9ACTN
MPSIRAPFIITARPAEDAEVTELPAVGRTTFDKVFAGGAIEGTSVVHFVSTAAESGPLAYVALERVEGTLDGRAGAFVLQHAGAIVDGVPSLDLSVVVGSGTRDLVGLTGSGTIEHTEAGAHLDLDYAL